MEDRIIECAGNMFSKRGIKSVTMDEIAKELGISKKTLYQFFKTKDYIVDKCIVDGLQKDKDTFNEIILIDDFMEQMVETLNYLNHLFENTSPILFHELEKHYPQIWKKIEEYQYNFIYKNLVSFINKGKTQAYVRKELQTEIVSLARLEQVTQVFQSQHYERKNYRIVQVQKELISLFIHGILNLKGLEKYTELTKIK